MTSAHALIGRLSIGLASALLALGLAPIASAQSAIPDCYEIAIHNAFPAEIYAGSRDQLYESDNAEWATEIAGLSPAQLEGYRAFFCGNMSVDPTTKDADGTQHFTVNWVSADTYLQTIGQRRGQDVSGSNTSATTALDHVLFETDFHDQPQQIEVHDSDGQTVDAELSHDASNTYLSTTSTETRVVVVKNADDWTDYAVETRLRATNGTILLATRSETDACPGYDAILDFTDASAQVSRTGSDCAGTSLQSDDSVDIKPNQWVTLRMEVVGDQVSVFIDGKFELIANDSTYDHGAPQLYLYPEDGKTSTLDVDSFKVTALHAPPTTLTSYDAAPGVAVAELQKLGQVPADPGELIFNENHVYYTGIGSYFQGLGETAPHTDIVMAGSMTFTAAASSDEYEDCSLIARLVTKGDTTLQELEVTFDNDGYLNIYEYADPDSDDNTNYYTHDTPFTPGKTYHLLFTLIGSQLAAYVDGKLTLVANNLVPREGYYGLSLGGKADGSRCDGRNVWVYSFK